MEVTKNLYIQPETIETIYGYFKEDKLLVNRRYQRKLVWTAEEKESFIDSISLNFPVPLILVAQVKFKDKSRFEIIDGMQRLDAIVSFIEGEFSLNEKYFDLESIASTKYLLDNGVVQQKLPKLDREVCKDIATYQIPMSISSFEDEKTIDVIFKRINSNGKHLSQQELRQAGSESRFAYLVRKLAESIRGDVSIGDRLYLSKMKNISINSKDLSYGINMGGVFWRKHNIVTSENIRQSRDEELIAHILGTLLIEPRPSATSKNLDAFYGSENAVLENQIKKIGEQACINNFEAVFEELRRTFDASGKSFHKVLFKKDTFYINRSFHVLFLAFYDLLVKEGLKITDYSKLTAGLEGVGDNLLTPNAEELNLSKTRETAVSAIKGIIRDFTVKRNTNDPALNNGVTKLENILNGIIAEGTNVDFKIGFHRLDSKGDFDKNALEKVLKSLTAMANAGKGSTGYIIVGIADDAEDNKKYEKHYTTKSKKYKEFHITGINKEIEKYSKAESYKELVENSIRNSEIGPSLFKDQLLRNIDCFNYYDKTVLILKIEADKEPCKYGQKYYERLGTQTTEIPEDKISNLWRRFLTS